MKVKIPRELAGVLFPKVLTIELNDFDIALFLPSLYFKILGGGRTRAKRVNDPEAIGKYIDSLAKHSALEGFHTPDGRRVLERLVRTSLITTGKVGRAKRGEQILAMAPYTLLTCKPGFPGESRRQRGADTFIYHTLRKKLGADESLRELMHRFFGRGAVIARLPKITGTYDGQTELDLLTRLMLAFLDGFEVTSVTLVGASLDRTAPSSCPAQSDTLADDVLRYLFAYCELMPAQALTQYLMALIQLELFMYTLRLVHGVNALVRNPNTLPAAMLPHFEPSEPEIYLDFTGMSNGLSQHMAVACVRRDIEAYQQFLSSNILLRQLDRYAEKLMRTPWQQADVKQVLGGHTAGPQYLQGLLLLREGSTKVYIEAAASSDEDSIREANNPSKDETEPEELEWLNTMVADAKTNVDRVIGLLAEGQRAQALSHFLSWFAGAGGLTKASGILSGVQKNRRSWRYAPGNDLLAVLVQLAAARQIEPNSEQKVPQAMSLRDFLAFLEHRFGILIDRPPAPFSGAEYVAAARDNLRAMLVRLRQMGVFTDLSDDFTVQRLHPPYADTK